MRERTVGDCIFFQGGTAYNDAVAAAFSQILGKEIIVPPHNGVMGAIGMALLARERMRRTGEPSTFRGWDLGQVDYTVIDFVCKACSNECDVRQFTIEGEKTYWGDKCSDRYRKRAKVDKEPVIDDLVELREQTALEAYERAAERAPRRRPRSASRAAMYTYDRLPFWATFFAELGLPAGALARVRQADPRGRGRHDRGRALLPDPRRSRARRVAASRGRRLVFVPNVLNEETEFPGVNSHACPWGQTLPFVMRAAPRLEQYSRPLPHAARAFRDGIDGLMRDLAAHGRRPRRRARSGCASALDAPTAAQDDFRERCSRPAPQALATLEAAGELGIVIIGRPYNMYDKGINMDILRKLRSFYGVNVVPMDFLPLKGIDVGRHRAQHVLELRPQDPPGGALRAATTTTCISST